MKIAIIDQTGTALSLLHHTEGNVLGDQPDVDGYFCSHPISPDLFDKENVVNTCVAVGNLCLDRGKSKEFNDLFELGQTPAVSTLFTLYNGESFGDWMEISYSDRFMSGNVGPGIGFATGIGARLDVDVPEAFPDIPRLMQTIREMKYRGELLFGISGDYRVVSVNFGHAWGHFAMYSEICKVSVQALLEFCFGAAPNPELYENFCVSNLVSRSPFPVLIPPTTGNNQILAPRSAEKHLWRNLIGGHETVLITCRGVYLGEARKRIHRTIENMLGSSPELQYRVDYGLNPSFTLLHEQYERFRVSPWRQKQQDSQPNVPQSCDKDKPVQSPPEIESHKEQT